MKLGKGGKTPKQVTAKLGEDREGTARQALVTTRHGILQTLQFSKGFYAQKLRLDLKFLEDDIRFL